MSDFSDLYRKHATDVYRFALYLSRNRGDAEDITAETFARAWSSSEPIRTATVKGYLFTIARNLFLQGLRGKSRQVELDESLHDPHAGPEALAEADEEWGRVVSKLGNLPEIDRTALLMTAFDGMPYEEIAVALGISLAAVKVKIHRARLALVGIRNGEI